jgi:predicted small metal-binding protein
MAKILKCRDVGFDCEGVVRAESEEKALDLAVRHAGEMHGETNMSPDMKERARQAIKDES